MLLTPTYGPVLGAVQLRILRKVHATNKTGMFNHLSPLLSENVFFQLSLKTTFSKLTPKSHSFFQDSGMLSYLINQGMSHLSIIKKIWKKFFFRYSIFKCYLLKFPCPANRIEQMKSNLKHTTADGTSLAFRKPQWIVHVLLPTFSV